MALNFAKFLPLTKRGHGTKPLEGGQAKAPRTRILESKTRALVSAEWALVPSGESGTAGRAPIRPLPFRVGRDTTLELPLASDHISRIHAEIYSDEVGLRVRDLGSRNGTFLNRELISDAALHRGDVLHFSDFEFRLDEGPGASDDDEAETAIRKGPLPRSFAAAGGDFRQLLSDEAVTMVFQPILDLKRAGAATCEALGRGRHPNLPESPVELFEIAGQLGPDAQVELSQLFRRRAVEMVKDLPSPPVLFLNTHATELEQPGLVESLESLRSLAPAVDLVLEIHESALAQTDFLVWLRNRLLEINVGLAYDDFGAGQARLLELAEAPPHFLKFDRRFVSGIEQAPVARQRLVAALVAAARELTVKTVAEGVETAEEAAACTLAGFTHAQGYHFARPGPLDAMREAARIPETSAPAGAP
jgi:EAL domain-containing protein (putative c-di-GMP-specific phosphodiesterase class I)